MAPRGLSSPAWPSPALAHRDVPLPLTPRSVIQPRSASLSSGAKAGVAVGSIAGFAILLCIAWPFFIAFKRKLQGKERYHPSDDVGPSQPRDLSVKSLDLEIQQPSQQPGEPKPDASRDGSDQTAVQSLQGHPIPPHYRIPWPPEQQQQQQQPAPLPQRTQRDWTDWAAQKLRRLTAGRDPTARSPVDDFPSPFSPVTPTWGSHAAGPPSLQPAPVLKVTSSTSQGAALGPFYPPTVQPISPPLDRQLSPPGSPISPDSRFPNATLLSEVDGAANTGLPSPPIGFIEPGYDPKQLWNPTTQTEHRYSVNHELTKLETASATASPSPPPQPTTELLQPPAEPYLDPRTPPSQGIPSPQSHDLEMTDITSDFSSPAGPVFTTASSRDTPETNFTHSEFNSMSPRSNMDSDLNYASPSGIPGTPMIPEVAEDDGNDATSSPEDVPTSPRIYKCDECNKSFEQIHRLNHHKRYHERKHECTVPGCGKKFGTKTHLDRHINDKHKKTRKFYCTEPTCPYSIQGGKSFPRKDNWVRHIRKKHRNLSVSNLEAMGVAVDEEAGTLQGISGPSGMGQPAPPQMPLGAMATNMGMGRMAMNFGAPMDMTGQPMPGGQYMPPQHMAPQHMGGQPGLAYGWNTNPMVKSEFP